MSVMNGECVLTESTWQAVQLMGHVRIRHSSHHFATQSSRSVDLAGWQAKMASIEFWIPWRNAYGPHEIRSVSAFPQKSARYEPGKQVHRACWTEPHRHKNFFAVSRSFTPIFRSFTPGVPRFPIKGAVGAPGLAKSQQSRMCTLCGWVGLLVRRGQGGVKRALAMTIRNERTWKKDGTHEQRWENHMKITWKIYMNKGEGDGKIKHEHDPISWGSKAKPSFPGAKLER